MGLEFKLSDRELPVSPVFIHFLARVLRGMPFDPQTWADQLAESLSSYQRDQDRVSEATSIVMGSSWGRERLARAYTLLFALLTGDLAPLFELQSRVPFVTFIGIPGCIARGTSTDAPTGAAAIVRPPAMGQSWRYAKRLFYRRGRRYAD